MSRESVIEAVLVELIRKSGVREFDGEAGLLAAERVALTAAYMADLALGLDMAVTSYQRIQTGTPIIWASASYGGTPAANGAITTASLANSNDTTTGGRQGVKLDFGATRAMMWRCEADVEFAATPTANTSVDIYLAPSRSATAGTDNPGGVSGTDAAYSGENSNLNVALNKLFWVGSLNVSAFATSGVQKAFVGRFRLSARYNSLVIVNRSAVAFHSSDANMRFVFTPDENVTEGV